ncbi:MAG: transcriptional regulator [Thermoplasmata archaeon]
MKHQVKIPEENTRTRILKLLIGRGMTAIQLKDIIDINESAIRKHLEILERMGLVDHEFKKVKRGRPKKIFSITEEGRDIFPKRTDVLLFAFIKAVRENYGEDALDKILDDVFDEMKGQFEEVKGEKDLQESMKELTNILEDFGFFVEIKKENDHYTIIYKNCVFKDAAKELGSKFCRMHRKLIENALGRDVTITQKKSFLKGDRVCSQLIKKSD